MLLAPLASWQYVAPVRRFVLASLAAVVLAVPVAATGSHARACGAIVVTKAAASYPHATTIQAGVDRARPCDWVLVAPGIYPEQVVIRTPHLHLRGLDRNRVIVDGRHRAGHGIVVLKTDDVWIENLTVRNCPAATTTVTQLSALSTVAEPLSL